ncbi:longitudinals lacking protein, isoforms H/M/V isoform X11 [Drosophila pseudoobscura]|uniref:Longitudinals lacking protein, isoforms H/M/V isoform X11 n=1 Tax=Drosophila pseudoobscura pseudoobscura TaxID=46245 RepID=A0A6I8V6R9_DROPS|nr:longitudinals lacking protein, isoforms H/M/V isoform X11 [Drosophila pseudoobscura]
MDDDQQFCLRWNNHQSTLISVFDTLLENETLVDCTLAAEGKFLKAHKVVLSACSPYFATLLQEQYDKHPIFILKDVKYQELRAMMDYMYRGEVNISQDQLAALLKAAESLQIKGLSDNRTGGGSSAAAPKPESSQHHRGGKMSGAYTLEQTKRARLATGGAMDTSGDVSGSREGSSSPSRRRRKVRRRSLENDAHDNSNSSVLQAAASNQSILQQTSAGLAVSALVSTQLSGGGSNVAGTSQVPTQQQPLTSTNVTKKTESAKLTSSTAAPAHAATATAAGQQQQQLLQQQTSDAINTENVQPQSQGAQGDVGDAEDMEEASAAAGGVTPAASGAGASAGAVHTGVVVKQLTAVVDKSSSNHKQKVKDNSVSSVGSEMVIEPKAEYDDDTHDENVEDLTLDEEDMTMEELDQTAGTSQGGEGSSQTYATWQHDRSQDELGLMAQDAQQRDPQDLRTLYCNFATAVVAAASAATKKPASADSSGSSSNNNHNHTQNHNHNHSNNCHVVGEICEPEVTIRRMYKCGHTSQSEAATVSHLQPGGSSSSISSSSNLHCIARNCSSCQMSAFQVASIFKSSMRSATAITPATATAAIKPQRNHIANNNNNICATATATATKKSSIQFHCEFCSFSCTWRYDLKLHLRQKHGIHQLKKV